MNKKSIVQKLIAAGILIASAGLASAQTEAPTLEFTTLTDGLSGYIPTILTAGMTLVGAGAALMAAPKGIAFAKRMWNAVTGR